MDKKRKILSSLLLCQFVNCGGPKVAVYDEGEVRLEEVNERAKMQLYEAEQQAFRARQQAAYEILQEKILELEAKKKNITKEELVLEYARQTNPVNDEVLRQIYEANKNQLNKSFEEVKDMLRHQLEWQSRNSALQNLTQELFRKYNVKFVLPEPVAPKIEIDLEDDPYWGPKDAKVVFVEFSDFECPYCKRMQNAIQQIRTEYNDRVRWVFKDFPLDFHEQAMTAHIAANCALDQNKYWEYQQRVFQEPYQANRKLDLSQKHLVELARQLGLNEAQFTTCLQDKEGKKRQEIEADIAYGRKIGVMGTPTVYANGRIVSHARTYEELKEIIEKLLHDAKS
ncbi:MAG: DsbA family protein [Leptospiraceae bacterium]|nr:DsbA family protein [Leptospiraceae bacterium]MDW8306529.1 thioredoxin domain-containing protein [Leptospiraceae bacterium]